MPSAAQDKPNYHHGNLHVSLLKIAKEMLNTQGIQSLSLRKISENVGVSRTAAYHHFKDKNDLLCAIAADGFEQWHSESELIFINDQFSNKEKFQQFVHRYINFATNNSNLYDLMFGRIIWKEYGANERLKNIAYRSFEHQVKMTKLWQKQNILAQGENALRLAQVIWGTLHGIAKLQIDGIYTNNTNIDEMCDCAVNMFLSLK